MQLLPMTERGSWNVVASESFGLQLRHLVTLCAIVAHWETTGEPISSAELNRVAAKGCNEEYYRLDPGCVSHLVRQGLVERAGAAFHNTKLWRPTRTGQRRVRA